MHLDFSSNVHFLVADANIRKGAPAFVFSHRRSLCRMMFQSLNRIFKSGHSPIGAPAQEKAYLAGKSRHGTKLALASLNLSVRYRHPKP